MPATHAHREEGIIIKDPNSKYSCALRGKAWIKLKPDYDNDACKDLDMLVIGGYRGDGIAGGFLESFLCGVIEKRPEEGEEFEHIDVHPVCRVKNGLRYEELRELLHVVVWCSSCDHAV